MQTQTTPTTKRQRNDQTDKAAARIYKRRFDIEKLQEQRELARQLEDVWQ